MEHPSPRRGAEAIALRPGIDSPLKLNAAEGSAAFIKRRGRRSSEQRLISSRQEQCPPLPGHFPLFLAC